MQCALHPICSSWFLAASERSSRLVSVSLSSPRRHSAWIGSLHLRVPVPRGPNRIIHAEIWEGVFRFVSPGGFRGRFGDMFWSEVKSCRDAKTKTKQTAEKGKSKSLPLPTPVHPQVKGINIPPFFAHSISSLQSTPNPFPSRSTSDPTNHGSTIRPSRSQFPNRSPNPPNRGNTHTPDGSPVRFPGKSRPPAASQALIPRASAVSS